MSQFAEYAPSSSGYRRLSSADGLVIRVACQSDLPQVSRLAQMREGGELEVHRGVFEQALQDARQSSRSLFLVAAFEERIIGYARAGYFSPPKDSPPETAPEGWYLLGVVIDPDFRRRGVGAQLTQARLEWIKERSRSAYYFANARNLATIELHRQLGFVELSRSFSFPGVTFTGGEGILFQITLSA